MALIWYTVWSYVQSYIYHSYIYVQSSDHDQSQYINSLSLLIMSANTNWHM